eukprot:1276426-Alexandrium_andersonii.AAC.1
MFITYLPAERASWPVERAGAAAPSGRIFGSEPSLAGGSGERVAAPTRDPCWVLLGRELHAHASQLRAAAAPRSFLVNDERRRDIRVDAVAVRPSP